MSKTREYPTVEWKNIPWHKLEWVVFKLQKRIYRASQRGDFKVVRRLQKTLLKSWSAKCLSVRQVIRTVTKQKSVSQFHLLYSDHHIPLSSQQCLTLANQLKFSSKGWTIIGEDKPKIVRYSRKYLAIVKMYNRALQVLAKLAIEPEWEAKFEQGVQNLEVRDCVPEVRNHCNKQLRLHSANSACKFCLVAKQLDENQGFLSKITLTKDQQQKHYWRIVSIIDAHKSAPQEALIRRLNPVIQEWKNYYWSQVSKKISKRLDHLVFLKLMSWAKHRHPKKGRKWVSNKYWHTLESQNWVFASKQKNNKLMRLLTHT
ncbi:MAG: hypothetical protein F6K36_06765 [Symploca sp. SIO3C6]|nr:hypothetical protein [Symploca sp. SIO3C6]